MGNSASSFLLLLLAGLVWGTTTPLIKRGSDRVKRHASAEDRGDALSHPDSLTGKKGKALAWWQVLLRDWEVRINVMCYPLIWQLVNRSINREKEKIRLTYVKLAFPQPA